MSKSKKPFVCPHCGMPCKTERGRSKHIAAKHYKVKPAEEMEFVRNPPPTPNKVGRPLKSPPRTDTPAEKARKVAQARKLVYKCNVCPDCGTSVKERKAELAKTGDPADALLYCDRCACPIRLVDDTLRVYSAPANPPAPA